MKFSSLESIFAWICLLFGYLFCRVFPVHSSPFGGLCFILLLFSITTLLLVFKKCKFSATPVLVGISAVAVSLCLFLTSNVFLHFLSYTYAIASYCYYVYAVCGNEMENGFSNFILVDYLKSIVITPFFAFGSLFPAIFSGKFKKGAKTFAKLTLGIALALIPTVVVFLLLSYDNAFMDLINRLCDWSFGDVLSHIASLMFGFPIGLYLFGLFVSSTEQRSKGFITKELCENAAKKLRFVPAISIFTAVVPILFLYVVFFISQWDYYISGFTGVLPKDFSYAEYAREGFFQLCVIALINFAIILFIITFMRRNEANKSVILKILSVIISVFTLVLISTALSKLFLYIKYYGLTHRRIYAAWLMVVLAVIFLLILLNQIFTKLKMVPLCACVAVIAFGFLALSNVDARIAEYNVKQYKEGSLSSVDLSELYDLEYAAIPSLIDLSNHLNSNAKLSTEDKEIKERVEAYLKHEYENISSEKKSIFSKTLPYMKAQRALNSYFPK